MKRVVIFTVATLAFFALPALSVFYGFFQGYEYAGEWGKWGPGNGEFKYPTGVAVDFAGNVSVADWGNHRIQRFTADGEYDGQFRTRSLKKAEFWPPPPNDWIKPLAVAVTGGYGNRYYYVSCPDPEYDYPYPPSLIILYDAEGNWPPLYEFLTTYYGFPDGSEAHGIALGPPNRLYVADEGESVIHVLTVEGSEITRPDGGDGIWVNASANEWFKWVTDVAVAPDGNIYVAAYGKVSYYDPNRTLVGWFNGYSDTLEYPSCVAVGPEGRVFVVDNYNVGYPPNQTPPDSPKRIKYFTPDGELRGELEKPGADPEGIWNPFDIAVSATGRVYVADAANHRILYYDRTYKKMEKIALPDPPETPKFPPRPEYPEERKVVAPE